MSLQGFACKFPIPAVDGRRSGTGAPRDHQRKRTGPGAASVEEVWSGLRTERSDPKVREHRCANRRSQTRRLDAHRCTFPVCCEGMPPEAMSPEWHRAPCRYGRSRDSGAEVSGAQAIQAVTNRGFELEVFLLTIAFSIEYLLHVTTLVI